jgi:N6-L-threonylcarbamoyladenine synthase
MNQINTILAIDTSCDETSVAVTQGRRVISNVLASQVESHRKYGGVYPTEAKRAHQEKIDPVTIEAMKRSRFDWPDIDAIAVTYGPGLAPALEVGIRKAKELCLQFKKPLIAVKHMEGHLLSPLAQNSKGKGTIHFEIENEKNYPILSLLASGGHTELVLIQTSPGRRPPEGWNSINNTNMDSTLRVRQHQVIGSTRDDAAGEAFDKVARMLKLGYPGGEIIELLAKEGDDKKFDFPIPMSREPGFDFSFSGIKTAAMYKLKSMHQAETTDQVRLGQLPDLDRQTICDFAASFQRAVVKSLVLKTKKAVQKYHPKSVWLGGGVGSNLTLRRALREALQPFGLKLHIPYSKKLFTDNAAMIGVAAYFMAQRGEIWENDEILERVPGLDL